MLFAVSVLGPAGDGVVDQFIVLWIVFAEFDELQSWREEEDTKRWIRSPRKVQCTLFTEADSNKALVFLALTLFSLATVSIAVWALVLWVEGLCSKSRALLTKSNKDQMSQAEHRQRYAKVPKYN